MAKRNFWTIQNGKVAKGVVEFPWEPGMVTEQRRKSCQHMHDYLRVLTGLNPMDISTASTNPFGIALSAFKLKYNGLSVECLYQGSKVYADGTDMQHLYTADSLTAKKSMQVWHGPITSFKLYDTEFPTEPRTLFYDFLYISAMVQNYGEHQGFKCDCWTDIQATTNIDACQARAVCEYVLLQKQDNFKVLKDIDAFTKWHEEYVEVEYEGYNTSYLRRVDDNTVYCLPEYEMQWRRSLSYTGRLLSKVDSVTYKVTPRDPVVLSHDWCVVYTDILLDDLCALQYLSYYYKNLYLVTVREYDMLGNPYCSDHVQNLDDLGKVVNSWFEKVIISRATLSEFGDVAELCDCFVMANATKVVEDLSKGIRFHSISAMIGATTLEDEWNASQDLGAYRKLLTYNINQFTKEFCEAQTEYTDKPISFLSEYVGKMQSMGENTCCYDLQMVKAAVNALQIS